MRQTREIREVYDQMTDVELDLRDSGTLEGLGTKWIANLDGPSLLEETLHEFIIDALLNKNT